MAHRLFHRPAMILLTYLVGVTVATIPNAQAASKLGLQQALEEGSAQPSLRLAQAPTEEQAFNLAKELNTLRGWEAFLRQHPTGFRADIASGYIEKLRKGNQPGQSPFL